MATPEAPIPYEPPRTTWDAAAPAPCFYEQEVVFPFLRVLRDPQVVSMLLAEANAAGQRWWPWPEPLYKPEAGMEWRVIPLCYTFPGNDPSKRVWVDKAAEHCPATVALLKRIPGLRTALFSRLGPNTSLASHSGWADLANHVLRCHLPLEVPSDLPHGSQAAWREALAAVQQERAAAAAAANAAAAATAARSGRPAVAADPDSEDEAEAEEAFYRSLLIARLSADIEGLGGSSGSGSGSGGHASASKQPPPAAPSAPSSSDASFIGACGLVVEDQVRFHQPGRILVFDDSKVHSAFNHSPSASRTVLIFDIARPEGLPLGTATGSTTDELLGFIDYFK